MRLEMEIKEEFGFEKEKMRTDKNFHWEKPSHLKAWPSPDNGQEF